MINFQSLCNHLTHKKSLFSFSVLCFYSQNYPLLFMQWLFVFLDKNGSRIRVIDVNTMDDALVKSHISTMDFTGNILYYLNGIHTLSIKKQEQWFTYLSFYNGPHTVIFFLTEEQIISSLQSNSVIDCVMLDNAISVQNGNCVKFLVDHNKEQFKKSDFWSQIARFLPIQQLSLDNACLLNYYELVVGKSTKEFNEQWLPYIIEPTTSLFVLSQYFFSKRVDLFFKHWSYVSEEYLPPFWVSFWADQVWRAYLYLLLMQQKQYSEAKKYQYKLPFSFINKDWTLLTLVELRKAHQFLLKIDYRLKNGGAPIALELFFGMFFENKFC